MLQLGKNITSANDPLTKISVEQLYELITKANADLRSKIEQLRTVLSIDAKRYRQLKTMLPYVTCGIFNPPYRRTENFGVIEYLILDIDHLSEKGLATIEVKEKLAADDRVALLFSSPSNDGVKALFRLDTKCYDHAQYSIYYKLFAKMFSQHYNLEQVIDSRTSDVTRACFLSFDPEAYFNPQSVPVITASLVDFEDLYQVREANSLIKLFDEQSKAVAIPEPPANELTPDIFAQIKQKLNPNIRTKPEKSVFVPEELDMIIGSIKGAVNKHDIEVVSIDNIQYGKKFKFALQKHWAEINVFFGKKGFSVVKTPKNGSHAELTEIVYRIVCGVVFENEQMS